MTVDETFAFLACDSRRFGLFDLAAYYEECRIRVFKHRGTLDVLNRQCVELGACQLAELTTYLARYCGEPMVTL